MHFDQVNTFEFFHFPILELNRTSRIEKLNRNSLESPNFNFGHKNDEYLMPTLILMKYWSVF